MGFEFKPRATAEINGVRYDLDVGDVGFVEGVVVDFAAILRHSETLERLREKIPQAAEQGEEALAALSAELTAANRALLDMGRSFIVRVLGEEAYQSIFSERRANSVEHVELCAYLYETAVKAREGVITRYVLPEKGAPHGAAVQAVRRRASPAGRH